MNRKFSLFLPALILLIGITLSTLLFKAPLSYERDVIVCNRLAKEVGNHWNNFHSGNYSKATFPFVVLDLKETILYQSSNDGVSSLSQALREGHPILDVVVDGTIQGKIIITDSPNLYLLEYRTTAASAILLFTVLISFLFLCYYFYLDFYFLRPFRQLENFAYQISQGNLNLPLSMKKNNLFGAFTESFDRMREQLMRARKSEIESMKNQKALVASLSHDIKTPITAIKLTSELLLELVPEERIQQKIQMISQKAEQIESLVSNLFHFTLRDMEQLTVTPSECYSTVLIPIIEKADIKDLVTFSDIPKCMVLIDELRITQVVANIINNSYKYANSKILVSAILSETYLSLYFKDFGTTLSEEELPYIFNQFYRGSNASKEDGSGLGLYICKKIMEQMQGKIYCTRSSDGFTIVLMIKIL